MRLGFRAAVLATLVAAHTGCAGRALRAGPRGSRADFAPARFEEVFARTVAAVRESGLEIDRCESRRGALVTVPVELDAPCGGTTCLARDVTRVKLGYRRASVTRTREVWNPSVRRWTLQDDPSTLEVLTREERTLVSRIVPVADTAAAAAPRGVGLPPDQLWEDQPDPCAPAACRDGACLAVSGSPTG